MTSENTSVKPQPMASNEGSITLKDVLFFLGLLVLVLGTLAAILTAYQLGGDSYYNPAHPMRWFYTGAILLSSVCPAVLMLGVARALKYLEEIKAKLS